MQAKNKELERQKTELENAEIIALVRGVRGTKGTPEELGALLEALRGGDTPTTAPPPEPEQEMPAPHQAGYTGSVNHMEQEDDNEI